MTDDGELKLAIGGLVVALVVIGSVIGWFVLFVGPSDGPKSTTQPAADEAERQSPTREPRERGPSLTELLGLLTPPEPAKCADPEACLNPSPELLGRYGDPTSCDSNELHICIVPLGDVPLDLVEHLVAYYKAEYGLSISVLRPITLRPGMDTERPGQIAVDDLRNLFREDYTIYDQHNETILLGLTAIDIYTRDRPEWRWHFGSTYKFFWRRESSAGGDFRVPDGPGELGQPSRRRSQKTAV